MEKIRATTIVAVKRGNKVAIAGDGQVSFGDTIFKSRAKKIRRIAKYNIVTGFAGGVADALTLFEKFELKLDEFGGNMRKAAVELAKDWRLDRVLRTLEALLIVADKNGMLMISGNGDVIEPDDEILAIGSGGNYAAAAAKALANNTDMSAEEIAVEAMKIAGEMCIFTNLNISLEVIE